MPPFVLPLIAGGLSLAGNLYSNSLANRATKKYNSYMDNFLSQRQGELDGWYKNNYYKDFMDTDVARSTLERMRSQFGDMSKQFDGNAVKSGATIESRVAGRGELAKRYAEALNNLAGYGTQYKDNIQGQYFNRQGYLDGIKSNFMQQQYMQRVNSAQNMGNNITNNIGALASAYMMPEMGGGVNGTAKVGSFTPGAFNTMSFNPLLNNAQSTAQKYGVQNSMFQGLNWGGR